MSRGTTLPVAASLTGLDGTRSRITWEKVGISRAAKSAGTSCCIPWPGLNSSATDRPIIEAMPVVPRNQAKVLIPILRRYSRLVKEEMLFNTSTNTKGMTSMRIKLT
ncbi:hypothetical protein D3C75_1026510 [compost metagenome]